MNFTIALVGRPNVGKSTLFNRLSGKKLAIVFDTPGVTRDCRKGHGNIGPLEFNIIDTPGLEEAGKESMENRMMVQTERAVMESDLVLLIVDGKTGINQDDKYFANWIRKKSKSVILVINKTENKNNIRDIINESYLMKLGEPVCISSEHGEGFVDLYDAIDLIYQPYLIKHADVIESDDSAKHMQIAIIGRPNAGKSTLLNQLIKTERVLTGPEAGITRDSISINWVYKDNPIKLIDTAGLRRKSQVTDKLEKLAFEDTLRAVKYAHVVILLVDGTLGIESQDITIANIAVEEGRSLVVAVNKWDLVEDKSEFIDELKYKLNKQLGEVKGLAIIYISALYGDNIYTAIDAAIESYNIWNVRINTAKLNLWLKRCLEYHPLPVSSNGRRIKIKYITQIKSRPPTFLLFTSHPKEMPDSYVRYLTNELRKEFELGLTPVRFSFKKGENPYKNRK